MLPRGEGIWLLPHQIKQCAWEIYLKNINNIYKNATVYFAIRFATIFFLGRIVCQPFLRVLTESVWVLALAPIDLWWKKSMLELIKGDSLPVQSCISLYRQKHLCRNAILLQLACQALNLWFWGIGFGLSSGMSRSVFSIAGLLFWLTPFLLSLAIQPVYVKLLMSPARPFSRLLVFSWKAMKGWRGALVRLWISLTGWLVLLLVSNFLTHAGDFWLVSLLFYIIQGIACVTILPYIVLCGIFFSLRVIDIKPS